MDLDPLSWKPGERREVERVSTSRHQYPISTTNLIQAQPEWAFFTIEPVYQQMAALSLDPGPDLLEQFMFEKGQIYECFSYKHDKPVYRSTHGESFNLLALPAHVFVEFKSWMHSVALMSERAHWSVRSGTYSLIDMQTGHAMGQITLFIPMSESYDIRIKLKHHIPHISIRKRNETHS